MSFRVRLTRDAKADLKRLSDLILERELTRDGGDLVLVEQAIGALRADIATLKTSPFTCRKGVRAPSCANWRSRSDDRATSRCSRSRPHRMSSWPRGAIS